MNQEEVDRRHRRVKEQFVYALMDGQEERARGLFDAAITLLPQLKNELERIEAERHKRRYR